MAKPQISIPVPEDLADQLPADPRDRQQVLVWGLREWKIQKALQAYRRGEGSLGYAAQQAGISLREMIPLAYSHGLVPKADSGDLDLFSIASMHWASGWMCGSARICAVA